MYQNYIFDLYGTLVDIETKEEKSSLWKKLAQLYSLQGAGYTAAEIRIRYRKLAETEEKRLAEEGGLPQEDVEICLEKVFEALFREKGIEPEKRQVFDMGLFFRNESLCHIRLFPGARELLLRLKAAGRSIYLLSNAQRIFTEPEMRMLGIYELFDGVLYSSDAGVKKPARQFYEKLFLQYQLDKSTSVMVGNDAVADAQGAHDFGIPSIYVHTVQSTPLTKPLPEDCVRIGEIGEAFGEVDKKEI